MFSPAKLLPICLLSLLSPITAAEPARLSFNRDIRPILSDNCFACHGFDAKERKADLRLDTAEGALADQAIVPGKPDESEAWLRILSTDPDEVMPPPEFHKTLTTAQRDTLKRWIEQGAEYEPHWSFVTPRETPVPPVAGVTHPVDAFLRDRLAREGLTAAPEADKASLIRRVTLDLTGLPPTPAEVDAFLADASPTAYETLVDGLLKRPTHGEHMARYWLDLARYADTHGLHLDNERSMWPYRDWVVRAFNENVPFDDFTRWQLAGDLLPSPTRDQLIASGFNRCNVSTSEGGSINEEWIYRYAVDRTSTMVEVWMGLTAGCAVCHDHKFDPISMKDYYSLYAFFNSAADPAMDGNKVDTPPILKLTTAEQEARLKVLDQQIAAVDGRLKDTLAKLTYTDPATQTPPPPVRESETVWFEDAFPAGASPQSTGAPLQLVKKGAGEVFSGGIALRRQAGPSVEQDFFNGGADFRVPANGKIFVSCFIDPKDPPAAIMIQFHSSSWLHRAVWGEEAKIPFGKSNTTEKVLMGALPKAGQWVRLEVDAARMGLKPSTKVTGYAFTQFGGTVTWDQLGVSSRVDPAKDPAWSFLAWKKANQGKRVEELPQDLRELVRGKQPEQWTATEAKQVYDFWLSTFYAGARDALAPIEAEKAPLIAEKAEIEKAIPLTFIMADLPQPRESHIMQRGAYDKPGDKVSRAVPPIFPPLPAKPADRDYNRLDLANWLVSGEHPLTARVTVNRFWQQFFGTGLVKTSADFGSQGEPPSHPELLDWLSVHFAKTGWDTRGLVRLLVTSAAYRQSSRVTPELLARDPQNRLLARGPRLRLDAEMLRDQALYVSGLLVDRMGGKGVNPYQPPNIWEPVAFGGSNTRAYKQGTGDDLYRRSLYTFFKRTAPHPSMSTFDAPNREQSCSLRERSNTPMQALQLLNDVQHFEAARHLAQRMMTEGGASPADRLAWGWKAVTARTPDADELAIATDALTKHLNRYESDAPAAAAAIAYGESKADPALKPAELAAYTLVANLLLNLDEAVMK
ncbi:MAG: PSD1 domain-containing protein [Verrucomicrobiales bacterium]|nr:PSD1 domain-containing protein [Verrucomicrobiales bacterium]